MSKEALKLAFKQAFDLGQTYWLWADSEYQSHWKEADAAKERFNQLVEDTISKALTEQQTDWEAVAADQAMTIGLLKAVQPEQRTWVGLTDEEYGSMYNTHLRNGGPIQNFTRAIEAKLKEKNT